MENNGEKICDTCQKSLAPQFSLKNKKRESCAGLNCIIFDIDRHAEDTEVIECTFSTPHFVCIRCEGLVQSLDSDILCEDGITYSCMKCRKVKKTELLETFRQKNDALGEIVKDAMNDIAEYENILTALKDLKVSTTGPNTKQVNDSLKELKVECEVYFGGTAMVGNMVHKIFNDFRENPKPILLQSLESNQDLYNRYLDQWKCLTDCDTYFSLKNPTNEDIQKLIVACESFCKKLPMNFPTKNITRKMDCLSLIFPLIIKEKKSNLYKYLKMEQEGCSNILKNFFFQSQ